jgi:putative ATP-dependent endonuclease of the OLD family
MYISAISIDNFRNFKHSTIEFNQGISVIVGHNNAGKTNLLKALGLVLGSDGHRKLSVEDFNRDIPVETIQKSPPRISISVTLRESVGKNADEQQDDKALLAPWLVTLEQPYEARLTYEFFLPEGQETLQYLEMVARMNNAGNAETADYWRLLKTKFIHRYVSRIYGGDPTLENRAEPEDLERFDCQYLDAIRDVERQMFTGRNTLLKEVLMYFLDYQLRNNAGKNAQDIDREIQAQERDFYDRSKQLIAGLKSRIDTQSILEYATNTGASIGGRPDFEGEITEVDMCSALSLIIEKQTGIKLPITSNGLGYNNLIFISLLLSKMQRDSSGFVGEENAKVFPVLMIEEPEAHLHPAMQHKFLKFLRENREKHKQVRQVFVTTHSTHITSAVSLDELICLTVDENNDVRIAYPGRVYDASNPEDERSKRYVKRFLDATKSDMLFSRGIILVEGVTEQLLMNCFAVYENRDLADSHVAVISVGGRYFEHFARLFDFDGKDKLKKNAICKKVACVADNDPSKKGNGKDAKWEKCYPFELNSEADGYEYRSRSKTLQDLLKKYDSHPNVRVFSADAGKGKTFEFDLAFNNPGESSLLVEEIPKKAELESMMKAYTEGKSFSDIAAMSSTSSITRDIQKAPPKDWSEDQKKRALIAARYHKSVEGAKGDLALQLLNQLLDNLAKKQAGGFEVPSYIRDAIIWACQ